MGWDDSWKLPEASVDRPALRAAVELLCEQHGLTVELVDQKQRVGVTLAFPIGRVLDVVRELDPDDPVLELDATRMLEELEPPWDQTATEYHVAISATDGDEDDGASITISSDDADNRRIWAAAHTLFRALAEAMCAEPMDEVEPLLWDSSAVLKPRGET